jgi:phage portal protein BeeE
MGRVTNAIRALLGPEPEADGKSWTVSVLVSDDGFMASPTFSGGTLYTVLTQSIWTYVCASRISQDISALQAVVQTREPGTRRWVTDLDHELNDLLWHPYGRGPRKPRWNWQQMIATGALRGETGGNQFYRISRTDDELLALGLLLCELTGNENQATGVPETYTVGSSSLVVPADQVVNVMHHNPDSFWSGIAPVVPAEQAVRVDYAASRRMRYDLETRVAPGIVIKTKGLFNLTDEKRDSIEAYLTAQYEGAMKAGKSLVVGDNTSIEGAPLHSAGDIPKMQTMARDAIISAYDISPPVVGVLDDARYQSWENALRAHFFGCILPRARNLYNTINSQAVWEVYDQRDVRIWFDMVSSPLGLAALRELGETAVVYQGLGWPAKHLNDRFALEMEPFEGWDVPNMAAVVAGRETPSTDTDEPGA